MPLTGYALISTSDQDTAIQVAALKANDGNLTAFGASTVPLQVSVDPLLPVTG